MKNTKITISLSLLAATILLNTTRLQTANADQADGSYAVVISQNTFDMAAWRQVAQTLQNKHQAEIVIYKDKTAEILDKLRDQFPKYICFIARPQEAGRNYVAEVHQLARKLDGDPYTDIIWAILTGYDAADALRIAKHTAPLDAKRILTATVGSPLDQYEEGRMYNELKKKELWIKTYGGDIEKKSCPTDITESIANDLNQYQADVFITSGHATEKDWNPGYGYRCGKYRSENGVIFGTDLEGKRHDVNSPNPKVHLAIGNCLIGHISDQKCMALALMRSAGVYQMLGYTVPTWYGYGGWGVKDYFSELQAGRFNLAQANYVNNLALVYELEKSGGKDRGLKHDRDVVVLYGDPAWSAKMPERKLPWSQSLTHKNGTYTFIISGNEKGDWDNRPVIELLPHRIKNIKITKGNDCRPVITDNFILVPVHKKLEPMKGNRGETFIINGDFDENTTIEIQFTADKIYQPRTP